MSYQIWSCFQNTGPKHQGICSLALDVSHVMEGYRPTAGLWEHWALTGITHAPTSFNSAVAVHSTWYEGWLCSSSGKTGDPTPLPVNDWDPFLQCVLLLQTESLRHPEYFEAILINKFLSALQALKGRDGRSSPSNAELSWGSSSELGSHSPVMALLWLKLIGLRYEVSCIFFF